MIKKRYTNLSDALPKSNHGSGSVRQLIGETRLMKKALTFKDIKWDNSATLKESIDKTKGDYITWLGHATYLIRLSGNHIIIDPFFSKYASPMPFFGPKRIVPAALTITDLPNIDYILLTHNHYDHLDKIAVKKLEKLFSPTMIVPAGLSKLLKKWGVQKLTELDWQESITFQNIKFTALPAYHFSRRTLFDTNCSRWCGYAMEHNNLMIFHSGDTGYGSIFKSIGKQFDYFDYAMIGIGAYQPREMMKRVHANPEEAVQIALDIRARTMLPMHWGTIPLTPEPFGDPIERLLNISAVKNKDIDIQLKNIGDLIELKATRG